MMQSLFYAAIGFAAAVSAASASARAADGAVDPRNLDYRVWEVFEFYPEDTQLECTVQIEAAGAPENDVIDWGIDGVIGPIMFGHASVFPGLAAASWTQESIPGGWRAQVSLMGNCRASVPAFRRFAQAAAAGIEELHRMEITKPAALSPALNGGAWWIGDSDYDERLWDAHRRAAGGCSVRAWVDLADAHGRRPGGNGAAVQYAYLYLAGLISGGVEGATGAEADAKITRLNLESVPETVLADAQKRARRYAELKNCTVGGG